MEFRLTFLCFFVFFLAACEKPGLKEGEGFVKVEGGKVWYQVVGSGKGTPLLLLHGGPGFTSPYLNPLSALSDDRPVIFYDQLGSGRSDVTTDPVLWTVEHFVKQLATLRNELGLKEVHILGHSWGAQLALDYLLTKPEGVKSLILASPAINTRRWSRDNKALLAQMPDASRKAIELNEREGTMDSEEYQDAMMVFYHRHIARIDPWTEDINNTFGGANLDLYGYMWGSADWAATGTLENYNREDMLPALDLPVLFTTGRYDEARPETVADFQSLTPNSQFVIFEESAHLTMQDEPEKYVQTVRGFLSGVEQDDSHLEL
jgi:L-proline amide hydrolase